MIYLYNESMDLSVFDLLTDKALSDILMSKIQKYVKMIKTNNYLIEWCFYCNSQILIRYDINSFKKSIKYWTYKLSQESEKCKEINRTVHMKC